MVERWVVHPSSPRISGSRLGGAAKVPAMRSIVGKAAEGYDFVEGRTHDGRKFRILTIIDEASRECLALIAARQLRHEDVLAALAELFIARGPPANIRSDNGPEFIATAVQKWLAKIGVKTLYIAPGSPWDVRRSVIDPGDRLPEGGLQRELQ